MDALVTCVSGSRNALNNSMRSIALIAFLSLAVAAVFFVKARAREPRLPQAPVAQSAQQSWPKSALDRAADVKSQIARNRQDDSRD
jgi:hypothetical protein